MALDSSSFGEGLMNGFSFVENIFAQRVRNRLLARQQEMDAARMRLADAEEARSQRQFELGLEDRKRQLSDITQTRRANGVLAQLLAANGDTKSLSAEDQRDLPALSSYDPRIAEVLGKKAEEAQVASAVGELQTYLSGAPAGGLGAVATAPLSNPATPSRSDTVTQSPRVAAADAFARDAAFELPPAPAAGTRRISRQDAIDAGLKLPPATVDMRGRVQQEVQVPSDFVTRSELTALGVPAVDAQKQLDAQIGHIEDAGGYVAAANAALAQGDATKQAERSWAAFVDVNDRAGDGMRRLAGQNPGAVVNQYAQDRSSLPAAQRRAVDAQIAPVIKSSIAALRQQRDALIGPDGTVDTSTRQYKKFKSDMNAALKLSEEVRGGIDVAAVAGVRSEGLPIGRNPELAGKVMQAVQNAPNTAVRPTAEEGRVALTQLNRFVASGARRMPISLVNKLPLLAKSGILSPASMESLLTTGTLPNPIQFHSVGNSLVATDKNGNVRVVMTSPDAAAQRYNASAIAALRKEMSDTNLKLIDEAFEGAPAGDKIEYFDVMRRAKDELAKRGYNTNLNFGDMEAAEVASTLGRFGQMKRTQTSYDNQYFSGWFELGPKLGGAKFNEKFDFMNFDEEAAKQLHQAPYTLPSGAVIDINGARQYILDQGDPSYVWMASPFEMSDAELAQFIADQKGISTEAAGQ